MQNARLTGIFQRRSNLRTLGTILTVAALGYGGFASASEPISGPMTLPQLGKRMGSPNRFFENVEPAMELQSRVLTESVADSLSKTRAHSKGTKAALSDDYDTRNRTQPNETQSSMSAEHAAAVTGAQKSAAGQETAAKPQLLPEEGADLRRVPAASSNVVPKSRSNAALKAAIKLALPSQNQNSSDEPGINDSSNNSGEQAQEVPEFADVAETPEVRPTDNHATSTMPAKNLALRHLSPSRFFQTGEPKLEMPSLAAAAGRLDGIMSDVSGSMVGISQVNAYRPVPPAAPPAEDLPADPTAIPLDSQAHLLRLKLQASENGADGSTNPIPPSPAPDGSPAGGSGGTVAEADKLGSAPESNNLQFLRTAAVLLDPGQCQFDYGLTYSVLDNHFPVALLDGGGDVVGVADARARQRQLIVPFAVRYGYSERIQLFANAPVGWASTEVAYLGNENESNVGGLGDINAGTSVLIKKASEPYSADVVATIAFTAPTGITSFPDSILEPSDGMGAGYWGLSESVLFIHTIDPVVLFYGAGFNHRFDRDFGRTHVDPGEEITYQFGAGFAVNPWITLSGSVLGSHLTSIEINNLDIEGTGRDPMRLRLSVTAVNGRHIIEPFAEVAMTEDSASRVGVVFTY